MKIIIDAMGGDHAPEQIVVGALNSAKEFGVQIVLVGNGEQILACMRKNGWETLPDGVEIAHADDVVEMHDDPAKVVQQHRTSSMVLGLKMLSEGQGEAYISAGNTGALLTAATLLVKRIRGIRRAALAPVIPLGNGSILIDAGANVSCTPEFLLQFACMGSLYAEYALKKKNPKVGLLNNGTEETKGDELRKETYVLLKEAAQKGVINFIGNIEAREAVGGDVDVIVADGFSGNIFLKTVEGTAKYMSNELSGIFRRNLRSKLGALCCMKGIKNLKSKMDYRNIGGSMIVGISKPVIKAHGSSDALAVRGAIRQAINAVECGFCEAIRENVSNMTLPREKEHVDEA